MYLSMPVLAAIAIAFVVLLFIAFRRRARSDDLMGAPPTFAMPPAAPTGGGLTPELEQQVRALVAAGKKINAVKLVREATGLGLKEALDAVERM